MQADLLYDGQFLKWRSQGLVFKATSGLSGHQLPDNHCRPDSGPIPEGYYKIFLADQGVAADDGRGLCALKPAWGIEKIPRGTDAGHCERYWANWGHHRARMEPADGATEQRCAPVMRRGFYLHDSVKGYSHGCIEVESALFPHLHTYHTKFRRQTILLRVKYVAGRPTNGGTKVQ